jgi:hypothetical protein
MVSIVFVNAAVTLRPKACNFCLVFSLIKKEEILWLKVIIAKNVIEQ